MDMLTQYWNDFWLYFREGLHHVNPITIAVISLLGAMAVSSFVGLFFAAAISVVLNLLVDSLLPVVLHNAAFAPPKMDTAFWHYALSLYILYFVAIGVLFALKSL